MADDAKDTPETEESTLSEVVANGRKISVTFERKISDGDYGTVTARAWVENEVSADADATAVAHAVGDLLNITSVAVFDQLGIAYHYDDEAGVIREDLRPVTEGRVAQAVGGTPVPSQSSKITVVNAGNGASNEPLPSWLIEAAEKDGVTHVFDNRLTAKGNQPLFRESISRGGVGHGKDGEPKAYWAPKGA